MPYKHLSGRVPSAGVVSPAAPPVRREVTLPIRLGTASTTVARVFTFHGLVDGREHVALGLGDWGGPSPRHRRRTGPPGPAAQRVPDRRRVRQPSAATAVRSCARRSSGSPTPAATCSTCARRAGASASTPSSTRTPCRTPAWTPTRRTWRSGYGEDERDYTAAAQMLRALGVAGWTCSATTPTRPSSSQRLGVDGRRAGADRGAPLAAPTLRYLAAKAQPHRSHAASPRRTRYPA